MYPYFLFVQIIAPFVESGRMHEYKSEYIPLVIGILVLSVLTTIISRKHSSNTLRKRLKTVSIPLSILGMYLIWTTSVGGIRE